MPYAPARTVAPPQAPHLPKIADYLAARLRDKDSTRELREACAAALGALVAELGPDAPPVVLRYLLPVLGETLEPVRLQPCVAQAATPCAGGCNPMCRRLQPMRAGGCSLACQRLAHMPEAATLALMPQR